MPRSSWSAVRNPSGSPQKMQRLTPSTFAAARVSASRIAASSCGRRLASRVPLSPLVATHSVTSMPTSHSFAIVPPARNSASSGCAVTMSARSYAAHFSSTVGSLGFVSVFRFATAVGLRMGVRIGMFVSPPDLPFARLQRLVATM